MSPRRTNAGRIKIVVRASGTIVQTVKPRSCPNLSRVRRLSAPLAHNCEHTIPLGFLFRLSFRLPRLMARALIVDDDEIYIESSLIPTNKSLQMFSLAFCRKFNETLPSPASIFGREIWEIKIHSFLPVPLYVILNLLVNLPLI